jgi:hypothetical protein
MARICCVAIFLIAVSGSAYGQASAGSAECYPNCGGGSTGKASNGSSAPNSKNARAAAAMKSIQNTQRANQQTLQNGANQILNVLTSGQGDADGDSNSAAPAGGSADTADDSNVDTPPQGSHTLQPAPAPDASAAVSALLDSDPPATSTASAVSALLDDSSQPNAAQPTGSGTTTANAVANLLDSSKVSDAASAFALPSPADPQFNTALQESDDQPEQTSSASMMQLLQSAGELAKDKLTDLISSGKGLLSEAANDPAVYWFASQGWNGTTAPLATPTVSGESVTDTPEGVADLVQGQAVVGFGDLVEGVAESPVGFAKGLYTYGAKMVDQIGAALGFADANILTSESSNSN